MAYKKQFGQQIFSHICGFFRAKFRD